MRLRFIFFNFGGVNVIASEEEDGDYEVSLDALEALEEETEGGGSFGEPDNGLYLFDGDPEAPTLADCRRLTPQEAGMLAHGHTPWASPDPMRG